MLLLMLVLLFIFVFEVWRIAEDIHFLREENQAQTSLNRQFFFRAHRVPPNPNMIASWMTFQYIEKIFSLPKNYLKSTLQISDSRYPRLSLGGYARAKKISLPIFLDEVIKAINTQQKMGTSTTATSTK